MTESALATLNEQKVAIIVAFAFVFIGFLDVISTQMVLGLGGMEVNPLIAWIMQAGPVVWVLFKMLAHAAIGFWMYLSIEEQRHYKWIVLMFIVCMLIVTHNFVLAFSVMP